MNSETQITPIGLTNWRNNQQPFGIYDKDRSGHIYAIGKTGVGKSTLLLNMAIADIQQGKGVGIIDPHGDLAETILNYIPHERIADVVYFNATDSDFPIAFNPLHGVHPDHRDLVALGLLSTFKKLWPDFWGPRLDYILKHCLLTLLEFPDATFLDIQPLLTDPSFRNHVLHYVTNPHIIAFWRNEFEKLSPGLRSEAISPILNKMGAFLTSGTLRNIVGQKTRGFRVQQMLDEGKILIVNLAKGKIGEDTSALLGGIILTSIQLAALHRTTKEEHTRRPFYLFVDEAHSFMTLSFADMLSESRKYGLSIFLTHQYIEQLHEDIRAAVFGNVGTMIAFRVGAEDAKYLAKEFYPVFNEEDLITLPKYSIYLKLQIDGATSKPFSALTLPLPKYVENHKEEVIVLSRKKYNKRRYDVEQEIFGRVHISEPEKNGQEGLFKTLRDY